MAITNSHNIKVEIEDPDSGEWIDITEHVIVHDPIPCGSRDSFLILPDETDNQEVN